MTTIKFNTTIPLTDVEGVEKDVELTVEFDYWPGSIVMCDYPGEEAEIEISSITSGDVELIDRIDDVELELLVEKCWEHVRELEHRAAVDAATPQSEEDFL